MGLAARLHRLLATDERPTAERNRLVDLMVLLGSLPAPPDPDGVFTDYERLKERFLASVEQDDAERSEELFCELYCHLHGNEAPYTPEERARVNETGGYWCHAGGLSPILKAAPWIEPATISADFGAGNGLQGLLLQKLFPHQRTVQIEISSRMVACGRRLQQWLGIAPEKVEWITGDICEVTPSGIDFIYLYRPVKPTGRGRDFYEHFCRELDHTDRSVVIFSIADCLKDFLGPTFDIFYSDGHLTCFRKP